ncbi:Uncharacterised protein [Bordetella ansorpii]|uniref:Uncharacterized protein n=1 Tax=Bordetella ansorpii TaxID=288768 RepID=A0A157RMV6_9BORD|nr:hypothetical protein [Bordetella ansorpii]SAI59196.1 Uncharacterised protein [Bordetella ansorpii]
MMHRALFACAEPRETKWQLSELLPSGAGDIVLFGWNIGAQIDDGIPAEVSALIAKALTSVARVTFQRDEVARLNSTEWSTEDGDLVRTLPDPNQSKFAQLVLKRAPSGINMVSTQRSETAAALFDVGQWPWWQQGQFVLLSAPDAAPPSISRDTLISIFHGEWNEHLTELREMGVVGVLRPGVDGDVFAVLFLTRQFRDALLQSLAQYAKQAGYAWSLLSEEEFTEASSRPLA